MSRTRTQSGFNYSYLVARARLLVGLPGGYERSHKGAAQDIKEVKTNDRRKKRRAANRETAKEAKEIS